MWRICLLIAFLYGCDSSSNTVESAPPVEVETSVQIVQEVKTPLPQNRCTKYFYLVEGFENPSRFMAQIEQESSCNPLARSPYADGLSQIARFNIKNFENGVCRSLGKARVHNEWWSINCGYLYLRSLTKGTQGKSYCDATFIRELRYNGGYWVVWEMMYSDGTFAGAALYCGSEAMPNGRGPRRKDFCGENYSYAPHITRRQTKYLPLGGEYCP